MVSKLDNIILPYMGRDYNQEEAERAMEQYILGLQDHSKPPKCSDLLDFFPLIQRAIKVKEQEEGVPQDKGLLAFEEDPPEEIDTEAITWSLKARVPGRFDQGPAGQGRIKEVTGHPRSVQPHPEHPNEKLVTMGRFYGNWISFNAYARDSKTALKRVLWFERLIDSFHWYFRIYGFRAIEEGVGDKEKVTIKDLELVKYPITYFIRSEDTYHITTQNLKRVLITTNVST